MIIIVRQGVPPEEEGFGGQQDTQHNGRPHTKVQIANVSTRSIPKGRISQSKGP